MSLRSELAQHVQHFGGVCGVASVIANAGKQGAEITELINDPTVPASVLARLLQSHGYVIKQGSITRHRRKECTCDHA